MNAPNFQILTTSILTTHLPLFSFFIQEKGTMQPTQGLNRLLNTTTTSSEQTGCLQTLNCHANATGSSGTAALDNFLRLELLSHQEQHALARAMARRQVIVASLHQVRLRNNSQPEDLKMVHRMPIVQGRASVCSTYNPMQARGMPPTSLLRSPLFPQEESLSIRQMNFPFTFSSSRAAASLISSASEQKVNRRSTQKASASVNTLEAKNEESVYFCQLTSQKERFPTKLYRMIYEAKQAGQEHIVSFLPHGKAFAIHDEEAFASEVMPRYFSACRLSSFLKQLNLYGFHKLTAGRDKGKLHYFHPSFLMGKPRLSETIQRRQSCKSKK